ncbi:MAG: hypothetical protein WCJ19_03405 [bacterium]
MVQKSQLIKNEIEEYNWVKKEKLIDLANASMMTRYWIDNVAF